MAIHFRAGNITAIGVGSTDPHKNLVVTGGTGSLLCARGRVHLVEYRHDTGSLRILLRWLRRHASQTPSAEQGAPLGVSSVPARTNLDSSP
jgi:hypothetical protein